MLEKCTCPITPKMSYDELTQIIRDRKMCTDVPGQRWMCFTLDKELARARTERQWRKRQQKQMKKEGYTEDQIKESSSKPRRKRGFVASSVADLDISDLMVN